MQQTSSWKASKNGRRTVPLIASNGTNAGDRFVYLSTWTTELAIILAKSFL
jgi:hypothetical protein